MALDLKAVAAKVNNLRASSGERDRKMLDVLAVRHGDMTSVFPDLMPDAWPKPIIANFVDTVARDLAETIAPLPALNCSSGSMVSDAARKRADKRTQIAQHYSICSDLQTQMFDGVDQYATYGFLPFFIEPDYDEKTPYIRAESPVGGYPEWDRRKRLISYTKVYRERARELVAKYPELTSKIRGPGANFNQNAADNAMLEMVRYQDKDQTVLFLPDRDNLALEIIPNKQGALNIRVARRPNGFDTETSGQFDDVIWVQLARAYMALLGLEATEKSVQAPLAVPTDVQEIGYGPDAVIRSQNPQLIQRVGMEMSPASMQLQELLDQEQRTGSRYPDGRGGNIDASVITGQGVQALMGTFDTQIKTAQEVFRVVLRECIHDCFQMDEYLWPDTAKTIRGELSGAPFEITYTPAQDIKGDYTIDVSYGFMAGMAPNNALVFMLQLRGDHLISRDEVMRQMPFNIDVSKEQAKIDVEQTRDALKQAIFGIGEAAPELVAQGQDPSALIGQFTVLINRLLKEDSIEIAAAAAFPPPPPQPPAAPGLPGAPDGGAAPDGSTPGIQPNGQVSGIAPGQQGQGPGGRPSLQELMAGLSSSGQASLQDNVAQRVPTQ